MKRALVLGVLIAAGTLSVVAAGYQAPAPHAPLPDLTKVKENLYIIESSSPADRSMFTGGNTGVFIMDTGVLVVDTTLGAISEFLRELPAARQGHVFVVDAEGKLVAASAGDVTDAQGNQVRLAAAA